MVLVEVFASVDALVKDGSCLDVPKDLLEERMPIISVQALIYILSTQNSDGSWASDESDEATAHSLIALKSLVNFPYLEALRKEVREAISKGDAALVPRCKKLKMSNPAEASTAFVNWTSITHAQSAVCNVDGEPCGGDGLTPEIQKIVQKVHVFADFFSSLEHMQSSPYYLIKASIVEALFYRPKLQAMRKDVFPATNAKEKDKYLDYIPIMWVFPGTSQGLPSKPEYLLDMMVLSMYVFLADEYMESTVAQFSPVELVALKARLGDICLPVEESLSSQECLPNNTQKSEEHRSMNGIDTASSARLQDAIIVFRNFATYIYSYPRVSSASQTEHLDLYAETQSYLLSHVIQLEDNARLAQQPNSTPTSNNPDPRTRFLSPRIPYHTWLNTIGAGHISGPWSFAFFTCVMSGSVRHGGTDTFQTMKQKLIAHSMNAHIGAFCRMYNDYGSIARDREESNLNSLNFPEFFFSEGQDDDGERGFEKAKKTLLESAVHERKRANQEMQELCEILEKEGMEGKDISRCLRVYMGTCEQFSDMYLTKDVTNSVK